MNAENEVFEEGVIVIEKDKIIDIGPSQLSASYPNAKIMDASNAIVMPGFINTHNHLSMVAFRGIAEYNIQNFTDRLVNYFFPLEKALLNRHLIYTAARHAAIELALAGVTTTADMYYHEDEVAKAVKEVGLRAILGETIIGFPVVDAPQPYGGLAYAEKFIQEWQDDPLITPAVAPHASYTVSPDYLKQAKKLADKYDVPILIHMSEIADEIALTNTRLPNAISQDSIVSFLDSLGFLDDNVVAAHSNYLSPADIRQLKQRGVGIAHNPKANTKDMSGLAPAWDMYSQNLAIGLGTDGPMSSNQMDILTVMGYAARVARIRDNNIARFDPVDLVRMATIGGAHALHIQAKTGSLEIGKQADLIMIETQSSNMRPNYDSYATLVYSAYPSNIIMTMVAGRIIAQDGQILTINMTQHQQDWQEIESKVRSFLKAHQQNPVSEALKN